MLFVVQSIVTIHAEVKIVKHIMPSGQVSQTIVGYDFQLQEEVIPNRLAIGPPSAAAASQERV